MGITKRVDGKTMWSSLRNAGIEVVGILTMIVIWMKEGSSSLVRLFQVLMSQMRFRMPKISGVFRVKFLKWRKVLTTVVFVFPREGLSWLIYTILIHMIRLLCSRWMQFMEMLTTFISWLSPYNKSNQLSSNIVLPNAIQRKRKINLHGRGICLCSSPFLSFS